MSTVLLVGGAAATGKSTLAEGLSTALGAILVRPADSYLRLADEHGIAPSRGFTDIPSEVAEVDYVSLCARAPIVVSDLHYAIQFERDSALALGLTSAAPAEPYVATLSSRLVTRLANDFNLLAILLESPPEVAFERAGARTRARRAASVEEVEIEMLAERREWARVGAHPGVTGLVFDTTRVTIAGFCDEVGAHL